MQDGGWHEHPLLFERYTFARHEVLKPRLQLLWWLWAKPSVLRIRLNRTFGWGL
jgi:hypothetical protein